MSQKPQELMVTLTNGTQVPWSEFKNWSASKQASLVMPAEARNKIREAARRTHTARNWSDTHRIKHREAMDAKIGQPSALKGLPGRKWTDEQKAAHSARQQLEHAAGMRRTTKGVKMSDEARAKMSEAARNRKGPGNNAKPIQTPMGVYASLKLASEALGLSVKQLHNRMKKDPTNYYSI